jgi:hypothetical protein
MVDSLNAKVKPKVENPATQFDKPGDVVHDKTLSAGEKKKALNTWEQDAHQLSTASNEGMPGSEKGVEPNDQNRLSEVVQAKAVIGEKPKHKPSQ